MISLFECGHAARRLPRLTAAALSLIVASAGGSKGAEPTPRELIARYQAAIAASREVLEHVHAVGTFHERYDTVIIGRDGKSAVSTQSWKEHVDYRRNGAAELAEWYRFDLEGVPGAPKTRDDHVFVANGANSFTLKKRAGSGPFLVDYRGGPEDKRLRGTLDRFSDGFIDAAFSIASIPVAEILASKEFRLKGVERVGPDGRLLKIRFEYRPPNREAKPWSGWWTVSPDDGWALREYSFTTVGDKDSVGRGAVRYGDVLRGSLRAPRRVETSFRGSITPERISRTDNVFEFDRFECAVVPERDFRLTAYGLPDLGAPGPSRNAGGAAYWAFGLAGMALAASVCLRYAAGCASGGQATAGR